MAVPFNFTEISIPDSELVKKATQLVAEVSPKSLYNHCIRTYLFGEILGQRDGLKYDRELLYLGAVMHDLGFTERFDGNQRFEIDGADAAHSNFQLSEIHPTFAFCLLPSGRKLF